jgi:hypothetical protein
LLGAKWVAKPPNNTGKAGGIYEILNHEKDKGAQKDVRQGKAEDVVGQVRE